MRSFNQIPPARIVDHHYLSKLLSFWRINRCEEVMSTLSPWQTRYVDQKVQEVVASPLPFYALVLRSDILCRFCGGQQGPERTESIVNTLSMAVLYKAIRVMPPAPGAAVGPDGGSAGGPRPVRPPRPVHPMPPTPVGPKRGSTGCPPSFRPPRPVHPMPPPKPIRIEGDLPPEWGKQLLEKRQQMIDSLRQLIDKAIVI